MAFLGLCFLIPFVFCLLTIGRLLLHGHTGKLLIIVVVCTIGLLGMIIALLQSDLDEAYKVCAWGEVTSELYRACRAEITRQIAVRMGMCMVVPTTIGLVWTLAAFYTYDRLSRQK